MTSHRGLPTGGCQAALDGRQDVAITGRVTLCLARTMLCISSGPAA
jgi:hypothetical protein